MANDIVNKQNANKKKMAAKAALAAAVGAVALSSEANASEAEAQMVNVSSLNNVVSTRRLEDGSLEIVLENGEVVKLGSDSFIENAGQFLLTPDALAEFTDGNGLLIVGAIAAAVIGIAVAASGGGDDDVVVAPPPVAVDPNVPTAGDDNIQGTTNADTIDGLAGDDTIDGLAGNDTITGNAGADTLRGGEGDDTLVSDGLDTIDGGVGIDTVDFSDVVADTTGGAFDGVIVDLDVDSAGANGTPGQDGAVLTAPPAAGGEPIVEVDDVENIIGSDFNDGLFGNNEANVIDGGAGNDLIHGFAGEDTLDGGEGIDTVLFSAAPAGVTVDLDAGTATGGAGNNTISNFENVTGSQSDDIITGDANDNVLNGNGGDDVLNGGGGADTLNGGLGDDFISGGGGADITDGGEGIDTVSFANIGQAVNVSVDETGTGTAAYLAPNGNEVVDTLANFEIIEGREDGGDTIDVSSFTTGVRVDLDINTPMPGPATQNGVVQVAGEDVLTLTDFENIVGTDFDDVLLGNNEANVIDGGAGNDSIHSFGGAGDIVDGGTGIDTLLLTATPVGTVVTLDETGSGTVTIGGNDADIFSNFENVSGSNAGDDVLTGNQVDNVLNGNGGDDILVGGLGNDTLNGGDGIDTIDFSDIDVPVEITVDADGNGTATRDTGFSVSVDNAEIDTLNGLSDADFVSEAVAGNIYFNIHTSEFGGGEIRGQLDTVVSDETVDGVRTIVITGDLDAAQEPNDASDSEATGASTTTIVVAADGSVTYSTELNVEGIAPSELISLGPVSAIHLHNAPAGVNGPVIQDVIVDAGNAGPALPFTVVEAVSETDTFTSIEEFILSDEADSFVGAAGTQVVDGGAGNDTLLGGGGDDTLNGGDGDDLLAGGGGTDVIDGGAGIDANSFQGIGLGVTANVAADGTGTAVYGSVSETFAGIENLTGSDNNDVLTATGAAANTLIGGLGDDFISGGGGADITDGGEGIDTVSFADIGPAVAVSVNELGNGTAVYNPNPETEIVDTLTSFENFVARDGTGDTIDLSTFTTGVRVDLDTNTPMPGPATQNGVVQVAGEDVLTLTDFENIVGTDFDDVLLGNNEANVIDGGAGNDSIHSFGGAGDIVDGGTGIDTLLLTATPVGTVVTLDETGSGTVTIGGNDADIFSNFENVSGSNAGDDVLIGNSAANVLSGNGGNDTLTGGLGADTFVVDQLSGNDIITDFEDGIDVIDVQDFGPAFDLDAAIAAAVEVGGNTVVTLDAETTVTLENFLLADLDTTDFIVDTAPAAATSSASVFQSLEVEDAPIFETNEIEVDSTDQDQFVESSEFTEDAYDTYIADMFEVA